MAVAEEARFTINDKAFAVDLPRGFCNLVHPTRRLPAGLARDVAALGGGAIRPKVVAIPCDRIGDVRTAVPAGKPIIALALGLMATDNKAIRSTGNGLAFWRATLAGVRYAQLVLGAEAASQQVRNLLQQQAPGLTVDSLTPVVDGDEIGGEMTGRVNGLDGAPPIAAAASVAPYGGYFMVASVVHFANLSIEPPDLADAQALARNVREVD
ncbi:MAG: hypothetical protein P1U65_10510 [Minwuia sp.]|nr:hypothetical protein [Minwuia sp.]